MDAVDGSAEGEAATEGNQSVWRLSAAFLCLGLINNIIYVIILSAALDLVDSDIPKGLVLFANIAPALAVKLGWPYLVRGSVRYPQRIIACTLINFSGVILVALFEQLGTRLFGIAMASFASGLGEMTILQLTTTYPTDALTSRAVGFFSSGTGLAGLSGALIWWLLRGLGVKTGLLLSSIIPFGFGASYFLLLPPTDSFTSDQGKYESLATDEREGVTAEIRSPAKTQKLDFSTKMAIAKPLVLPFMMPLFFVYLAEYSINQGVAPNLLYPVPTLPQHPILGRLIHKLSDYYPLWQLVYQTFVFMARSSTVLFRVPPLKREHIFIPTLIQICLLVISSLEASHSLLENIFGSKILPVIFVLIACEGQFLSSSHSIASYFAGLSGGYSYVSAFSRLSSQESSTAGSTDKAHREFQIACVGFADTSGILAASLLSMWLEPTICKTQVANGKLLCTQVK